MTQTAFVISDTQYPHVDRALLETTLEIVRDLKPSIIAVAGDGLDFEELGRYKHDPYRAGTAKDHVDGFHRDVLSPLVQAASVGLCRVRRIYLMGNHEHRYNVYVAHNAGALGQEPDFATFAELYGWEVHQYGKATGWWPTPDLLVSHGWQAKRYAGMTARANAMDMPGVSVLTGHTHRVGSFAQTFERDGQPYTVSSWEMGHMSNEVTLPKSISGRNDWQKVAGAIVRFGDWGHHVEILPVVGNRLDRVYVEGREYKIPRLETR